MKNQKIDEIIEKEWEQFQAVSNQGGSASCQSDWTQFEIMRKSQFMIWPEDILDSYFQDLSEAEKNGRNLLSEKYAWMMESTSPQEFHEISDRLPTISKARRDRVDITAKIQAKWGEAFAKEYPLIGGQGRPIYSVQDSPWATSIETYSRGELLSYSENTEKLFSEFVHASEKEVFNLSKAVRENMIRFYGYSTLEAFERKMQAKKSASEV